MSGFVRWPRSLYLLIVTVFFCLAIGVRGIMFGQESRHPSEFMEQMVESMIRMDLAMKAAPMNGDVDHDFAMMMIPHHRGAIDMAKAELLFGKDPVMRRIAQEIVVDQKSEIDAMELWVSKQPKTDGKPALK